MEICVDGTGVAFIIMFVGTVSAVAGYWLGLDTRRFKASKKSRMYKDKDSETTPQEEAVLLPSNEAWLDGWNKGYKQGREETCAGS